MGYKGHKAEWSRDKGIVHGHASKHPALHQAGQHHTSFEARGFHGDKGHNTSAERISLNFMNRHRSLRGEEKNQINVSGGHDPRPEHYHKNSGTSSDGHRLIRRGASKFPVG